MGGEDDLFYIITNFSLKISKATLQESEVNNNSIIKPSILAIANLRIKIQNNFQPKYR
jgi:hypothetical protein